MTLRSYFEEYLNTVDEIMQRDDSEIISAFEQHWSKEDPRWFVFWEPETSFGNLSSEMAGGIDPSPHSNELPAGFRAHVQNYMAEIQEMLREHPNADDQALEQIGRDRWGRKDPRLLVLLNGLDGNPQR